MEIISVMRTRERRNPFTNPWRQSYAELEIEVTPIEASERRLEVWPPASLSR